MERTEVYGVSKQHQQFDDLLKSARVPERSAGYWENFPKRVSAQLSAGAQPTAAISPGLIRLWLWGLAAVCGALVLCFGLWMKRPIATAQPNYAKLYHEIESMFPNQVRAIVVEHGGIKLDLSDQPNVPSSSPLRVDVCYEQQCRTYITLSGQQILVGGERCEVLSDGQGHVLVAGRDMVWTSEEPSQHAGGYHIEGQLL